MALFWDNKKWSLILIKIRERNLHLSEWSGIAIAMGLKTMESVICNVHHLHWCMYVQFLYSVQPSRGASSFEPLFSPQFNVYAPFFLVPIDFGVIEDLDFEWRNSAHGSHPESWYITQLNFLPVNHHGTKREAAQKKSKHPSLWGNFARGLCPI